jgi:hypothetical protein
VNVRIGPGEIEAQEIAKTTVHGEGRVDVFRPAGEKTDVDALVHFVEQARERARPVIVGSRRAGARHSATIIGLKRIRGSVGFPTAGDYIRAALLRGAYVYRWRY